LSFLFDISRELVAEQERWSISRLSSKVDALVTGSFVQVVHVDSDGASQALKARYEVIEFEIAGVPNKTLAWFVPNEATPKEWHLELLRSIADLVSLFMQVKNNKETEKRLLISEERAVIARELHDSLAQSLSYIKFQVSILESIMGDGSDRLKISECLSELRTSTSKAYEQLRNLLSTFRLRLEDMTFWEAVEQSADEFAKKGNISIRISRLSLFEHLDAKRETHLLQIIRECLSNVLKHAKAKNAQIVFEQKGRNLQVMVIDDGIGFTPQNNNQGHFGIAIIQERAEALGAKVKYLANKPSGTKVLVALQI
jgi:two-component system nitrate/nitrite sensor histidine kinase NarX